MPVHTFEALQNDLARNRICAVYLLAGPEEYLLQHALLALKDKIVAPESQAFNLVECSAASTSAAGILHEVNSFPLMPGRRLVVVREVDALPADAQPELLAYIAAPQARTVLVLIGNPDRRLTWYKRLLEHAVVVDCQKPKGAALESWTAGLLSRRGYHIGATALRKLVELAGSDLLSLENEIEKLIIYSGTEKQITEKTIGLLVPASRQQSIFDLTNALGRRDRVAALKLLGNLLETGEPPLRILTMMSRQFRQMLIAQELLAAGRPVHEIGRTCQVPEFVLNEFIRQVKATEPRMIRRMFQRLAKIDRSIKSSSPDDRLLLERWICSL